MSLRTVAKRVGERRLLKLAAFLRKLPPERFNFGHWVGLDWKGDPALSCGTTACALGWATAIPSLRRAGLELRKPPYAPGYVALAGRRDNSDAAPLRAARVVFGLSSDEARFLFVPGEFDATYENESPCSGASADEVADHIERFVTNRHKEG